MPGIAMIIDGAYEMTRRSRIFRLFLVSLIIIFQAANAFGEAPPSVMTAGPVPLVADPQYFPYRVPAPERMLQLRAPTSTITVEYVPAGQTNSFGDLCMDWPVGSQAAFNHAVSIWQGYLVSSVPIVIEACWTTLGAGILGHGGAYYTTLGSPTTFYPNALADAILGYDGTGTPDIMVAFNDNFSWYFGTDGNPVGGYDFSSVVLHEIGHGLGFAGTMRGNNPVAGQARWGWGYGVPAAYDRFTVNGSGQSLINTGLFANPSAELFAQLTSNNVYFTGPDAVAANSGANVGLYAPSAWSSGSSYAHLAEVFNGTPNALMTYSLSWGEAAHDPGPVTLGLLKDIGWTINEPDTTAPPMPTGLSASPASWTNSNLFSMNWTNPSDPSGIAGAWYKVGSIPSNDTDGTYTTNKPFNAAATSQGGQNIYVWLQDGAGNSSFANRSSTTINYDGTAPANGSLSATPALNQASLSWSGFSDTGGSGLRPANTYKVVRSTGSYPSSQCGSGTQVYLGTATSTTNTGLTNGQTYYYRACAYDTAGNVSTGSTASASIPVQVTVNTFPAGRLFTVDVTSYSSAQAFTWTAGAGHTISVASPQDGGAGTQYVFSSWSDGGAMGHTVSPLVDAAYTANFTTQYQLTTSSPAGGTVHPDCPGGCWQDSGPVSMSAIPAGGYVFGSWGGACSGLSLPEATLTMDGPKTCSANFSTCADQPVRNERTLIDYASVQAAYDDTANTLDGDTIQIEATYINVSSNFSRAIGITFNLRGGYGCGFTGPSSFSFIQGPVIINRDTVTFDSVVIL